MKNIALATVLAMFGATSAFAGNPAPVVSDEPMMVAEEETGSMGGGSATYIIPLIALAAIAYAVSQND